MPLQRIDLLVGRTPSARRAIADAIHSLNPALPVPLDAPATPEAILRAVQAVKH